MRRALSVFLHGLVAFAIALSVSVPVLVASVSDVVAQDRQRPNLLDVLRRRPRKVTPPNDRRRVREVRRAQPQQPTVRRTVRKAAPKRQAAPRRTVKRQVVRKRDPRKVAAAPAAPAAPAAVEKVENARTILVVGDFLAGGIADGFEAAFAESPGVRIVDASNGSSGLVRDDYYDWQTQLPILIDEHEPAVVVVQLGANDGQPIRKDGRSLPERSDEWMAAYDERIAQLAGTVAASGADLVWVGAPAFSSRSLTNDMIAFNEHFRAGAEEANAVFVDVWDGFVDQSGAYIRSGPDVNGQVVRLRNSDGINLTRAGRRKMAFFAEKHVRQMLDGADDTSFGSVDAIVLAPLGDDLLDAPLQPRMSAPLSFGALSDDGVALEGSSPTVPAPTLPRTNPGLIAVDEGTPEGRADNFSWPPQG